MPRSPEAQRAFKRDRYHAYKQLCKQRGVRPDYDRWWAHYSELVDGTGERRLTVAELKCWWTERLTADEIREIGGALDFLGVEEAA